MLKLAFLRSYIENPSIELFNAIYSAQYLETASVSLQEWIKWDVDFLISVIVQFNSYDIAILVFVAILYFCVSLPKVVSYNLFDLIKHDVDLTTSESLIFRKLLYAFNFRTENLETMNAVFQLNSILLINLSNDVLFLIFVESFVFSKI